MLLTLQPVLANASPSTRPTNMQEWYDHVRVIAEKYGMDPYLCLALAEAESSGKGERVRFGKMGKTYYGPFGIHKCFLNKWDIDDWKVNTEVGIRALSNHIHKQRSLEGALRKYNTGDGPAQFHRYIQRIKQLRRKWQSEKIFYSEPRNYALRMAK